jgi:Na+-transporting NADH:ubiquinone oxidoreductase subunit C
MQGSVLYNLGFAAVVCVVCAILVSSSAVLLRDRQEANQLLEKQRNVLIAAGLATEDESLQGEEVADRFAHIRQIVIDLRTGEESALTEPTLFDQRAATRNVETSREAPENIAGLSRVAYEALVYEVRDGETLDLVILPVEGLGLWSTLYGFVALDADLETIRGLTFYAHGETPGLGGEVDNPRWKSLWPGRRAFEDGEPAIEVIKGQAGSPEDDPHRVDGLAGATITGRGVTNLLRFWLGEEGFRPYLERLRQKEAA